MKAGWIGLGAMGGPMAGHLHRAGLLDAAWNRGSERLDAFIRDHPGVHRAESPATLAARVDVVLVCVSADPDLEAVLAAMEDSLRRGCIVVDHSTVSPDTARRAAEHLKTRQVAFVDAPVTGGVEGARDGRLAVMAGGEAADLERLGPLLDCYARIVHRLGPAGSGQAAKAVNQLMVAGIAEAVCEALALMERLELPRDAMLELLGGGAAGNWFLDKRGRSMLEDRFETGFDPRLLLKDLRICRQVANCAGLHAPLLGQAIRDYDSLLRSGLNGGDISSLIRLKRPDISVDA